LVKSDGAGFAFTSIGEAIDSAQAGDTVVIFPRKDGQTWAITKTLTKPMVFLNGDSSGNILSLNTTFTIGASVIGGDYYFSNLGLSIINSTSKKVILNKMEGSIEGKSFECFNSQLSIPNGIDASSFFYSSLSVSLLLSYSPYGNAIKNSKIIGCRLTGLYSSYNDLLMFSNSVVLNNYFDFTNYPFNSDIRLEFSNVFFSNNVFLNNLFNRSFLIKAISDRNESVIANNYFDSNILSFTIQSTLSEGNYYKSADPNVRNTLSANGYKQASNIQLDSIGRIIGNVKVKLKKIKVIERKPHKKRKLNFWK
jgi:hypothetical protein